MGRVAWFYGAELKITLNRGVHPTITLAHRNKVFLQQSTLALKFTANA